MSLIDAMVVFVGSKAPMQVVVERPIVGEELVFPGDSATYRVVGVSHVTNPARGIPSTVVRVA